VAGIETTLGFGKWAVQTEPFRSGHFDTKFIDRYFKPEYLQQKDELAEEVAALLTASVWEQYKKPESATVATNENRSNWKLKRR